MTFQNKGGFRGLLTATSESTADAGAMRVCDNAVVRREGALEPRQGFAPVSLGYTPVSAVLAAHPFGTATLYEQADGVRNAAGQPFQAFWLQAGAGTYTVPRQRADIRDSAMARGNLYAPMQFGVVRVSAPSESFWKHAGITPMWLNIQTVNAGAASSTPANDVLQANTHVGYRVVARRTDPNGTVTRSRPSGVIEISNATAGTAVPTLGGSWSFTADEYDTVEIYRTRSFPTSAALDDEMQLVAELARPSTAGTGWTFVDTVADSKRTTTLYTSPSRGGMENANDRPPGCACVELFKQCMFFGNTAGPGRYTFSFKWGGALSTATGVGQRTVNLTTTAGSTAGTVASATGLQAGMTLIGGGLSGAQAGRVWLTAVSGTNVTLSQAATNTGTFGTLFTDSVEINGTWVALATNNVITSTLGSTLLVNAAYVGAYELSPANPGYTDTVVLEQVMRGQSAFTLRATHGDEMSPPLPLYGQTAATSKADVYPNGLMWSSPDEPEHVPPKFYVQVGDKAKAILGLCALRDAMLVLKEDGIWAVTGTNGNFTVTPLDLTTYCVLPSSVQRLNNRCYMLSNKGLVAVDESGVEVVSLPIADELTKVVDVLRAQVALSGTYQYADLAGVASYVDDRNAEIAVALPAAAGVSFGGDLLVYNARTNAFTTFSFTKTSDALGFTPSGYGVDALGVPLVLHTGGVRQASYQSVTVQGQPLYVRADGSALLLAPGVVAQADGTYVVTYLPATQLRVGDVLVATQAARIVSVQSSTQVTCDANPGSGNAGAYRTVTSTLEPQGFSSPQLAGKLWTHAAWALSRLTGAVRATARFSSATPTVLQASQQTRELVQLPRTTGLVLHHEGTLIRMDVPQLHRRGWLLRIGLELELALGDYLLEIVAADSRENAPQKAQTHSTGAS